MKIINISREGRGLGRGPVVPGSSLTGPAADFENVLLLRTRVHTFGT